MSAIFAHLVPGIRDDACRRIVAQIDHDYGLAWTRVAVESVEIVNLFELLLQAVG